MYNIYHHQAMLAARISLTLSLSLSSIIPGKSSRLHLVFAQSWSKYLLVSQHWQVHSLEQAPGGIGFYMKANKTKYISFKQKGGIFTLSGKPLIVDQFTNLSNNISSTEYIYIYIDTHTHWNMWHTSQPFKAEKKNC